MSDNRHMNIPSGVDEIDREVVKAKKKYEHFTVEFNKMLVKKIVVDNKTAAQEKMETGLAEELLKATVELDKINFNEGTYGLLVLSMRIGLFMRDRVNSLEHQLQENNKKIDALNKVVVGLSRVKE